MYIAFFLCIGFASTIAHSADHSAYTKPYQQPLVNLWINHHVKQLYAMISKRTVPLAPANEVSEVLERIPKPTTHEEQIALKALQIELLSYISMRIAKSRTNIAIPQTTPMTPPLQQLTDLRALLCTWGKGNGEPSHTVSCDTFVTHASRRADALVKAIDDRNIDCVAILCAQLTQKNILITPALYMRVMGNSHHATKTTSPELLQKSNFILHMLRQQPFRIRCINNKKKQW